MNPEFSYYTVDTLISVVAVDIVGLTVGK